MEMDHEFVERALSVLTGRIPVPVEVKLMTAKSLKGLRDQELADEQAGHVSAEEHGGEPEEVGVYIRDRSLCASAWQRELVIQYLLYLARHELGLPSTAMVDRQTWVKTSRGDVRLRLTNVIVTLPGSSYPEAQGDIVIGAHHDVQNNLSHCWMPPEDDQCQRKAKHHHQSGEEEEGEEEEECEHSDTRDTTYVATAGADDNGSGVVGCLALLRRLARQIEEQAWNPKHTIRVVFFDGEEPGLRCGLTEGSAEFVRRSYLKPDPRPINFALIIDMIGAPPSDESVGLVLSHQEVEEGWLTTVANTSTPELLVTPASCHTRKRGLFCLYASDSRVFAAAGLPVVLMCNTHLGALPWFYHNELDTIDNIDWTFLLRCVNLAEAIVKARDLSSS